MRVIENIPQILLNKLNINSNFNSKSNEIVEVVIISGDSVDNITQFVDNLGGKYEDLGYGFGIVDIAVDKLGDLASNRNIQYIEIPKSLYASDTSSNRASCVPQARNTFNTEGLGVLVGFIDSGIDYMHPAFRNDDGTTRIEYIYDLSEGRNIYNKAKINEALKATDPLLIVPSYDQTGHGTHVAGIACAGGRISEEYYGVAPKSSIAMVKSTRGNFSLSTNIMRGLKFLLDRSKELKMPLVVNISLSTNDGAHNGKSLLEQYISIISTLEIITICIAAGNEGAAAHHVGGELAGEKEISINIAPDERSLVINLYTAVLQDISIRLVSPTGATSGYIQVREGYVQGSVGSDNYGILSTGPKPFDIVGEVVIYISPQRDYILSGQWEIFLRVDNNYTGIFDMWLPILEGLNVNTKFLQPTVENTLGIPATVSNIIAVGSYNYVTNNISDFSGRGRLSISSPIRPDLVAPGENITSVAPNRRFDSKTGTSMATPHVSGIAALLMEWGIIRNNDPYIFGERLKYFLVRGARRNRTDVVYPDISWGYGEVCAYRSFQMVEEVINSLRGLRKEEVDKFEISGSKDDNELLNDSEGKELANSIIDLRVEGVISPMEINNLGTETGQGPRDMIALTVEYTFRELFDQINNIPFASAVALNESFGLVVIPIDKINLITPYIKGIFRDEVPPIYTLQDVSPVEASGAPLFNANPYLNLNGRGVIVGILDTGIDYLNEEFQREDDSTRIIRIWDQTIENEDKAIYGIKLGIEYNENQINEAIKLKASGGDPYSIVPSRDEIGHGTMSAGIIGGRGKNPDLQGAAPDCEFVVVKMINVPQVKLDEAGITNKGTGRYSTESISLSVRYLSLVATEFNKPLVIYMPVGSNMGSHDGTNELEGVIDNATTQLGVSVINGTGNEGDTDTHTEGKFNNSGEIKTIEIVVGKNQKNLFFNIYIAQPDKVSISITSPSGEVVEKITAKPYNRELVKFVYEGTEMEIVYTLPYELNGDEVISIKAVNIREGIWKFRLYGDFIVDGRYWSWLPQRSLMDPDTKFLNPSPFMTLTIPATSLNSIVAAYYNQNNNATVGQSGRGFTRDDRVEPSIAAGGINATIIKPGGGIGVASGASVATSVLAGCCALMYQWGLVDGNDKTLYTRKLKSYIIRGAQRRQGDIYPNEEWGYGMLSMQGIFDAIRGNLTGGAVETRRDGNYSEYNIGSLFIRDPN